MQFPEWTPELEAELRTAYQTAPTQPASGGSRHGGLKAVYDLLKAEAQRLEDARMERERREESIRSYNASMSDGPWEDARGWMDGTNEVGIPPSPFL